jgi:hypothetical protein
VLFDASGAAVHADNTEREPRKRNSDIPQQLHARRLPTSSLTLGPGQVAIVPITFLPRFPVLADDEVSSSPSLATSRFKTKPSKARACSIWQQADLEDWLGGNHAAKLRSSSVTASGRVICRIIGAIDPFPFSTITTATRVNTTSRKVSK